MKKIILLALTLLLPLFAHRVNVMVDDNGDGTVYIETGLSTGGTASGAKIHITERATGRPLWQGVIPKEGHITTDRPNVPYSIHLKMGKGHTVTKQGPALLPITQSVEEADTTSEQPVVEEVKVEVKETEK